MEPILVHVVAPHANYVSENTGAVASIVRVIIVRVAVFRVLIATPAPSGARTTSWHRCSLHDHTPKEQNDFNVAPHRLQKHVQPSAPARV